VPANVPRDAEILWEEQFGPVLPVLAVRDAEEVLDVANQSRYGLDSAVFPPASTVPGRSLEACGAAWSRSTQPPHTGPAISPRRPYS